MSESRNIGALWQKESQKGIFYTGYVEVNGQKVDIVMFPNGRKKEKKHPDFTILLSQPRNNSERHIQEEEQNQQNLNDIPL